MSEATDPAATIALEPAAATRPGARVVAGRRALDVVIGLGLFAVALPVYIATLTPSLSYLSPDGNELATVPYILGLAHSTGYPLYTWLGKLFTLIPVGDVAHRMNLMSAVMGAGGVVLLYGILLVVLEGVGVLSLGQRRIIAGGVALLFAFSRTFWSQTGISEVYAPNVFMVGLQTLLVLQWGRVEEARPTGRGCPPSRESLAWFGAFCLVFALSTGTHASSLGFGLGYAVFVLAVNWRFAFNLRALAVGVGLFALGMLQHLWLPYKASTLTDPVMLRNTPTTWQGFYNYTLGAFSNFKFAFTWVEVPDRVVIYLDLLRQQFGVVGMLIGIGGMWALLLAQPKRWWLISLMYLVHLVFFTQYRVFDLDVFFIPAHYLFAVFMAVGVGWLASLVKRWIETRWTRAANAGLCLGLALVLAVPVGLQVRSNWAINDRSGDVAINDFYRNVWEVLPPDSVLLGRGGVFGYDMFYWRLVYDVRPDVLMPHLPGSEGLSARDFAGREVYTTSRSDGAGGGRNPWSIAPGTLPEDAWYVPMLIGEAAGGGMPMGREALILYRVGQEPPALSTAEVAPQMVLNASLGGLTLLGIDVDAGAARPGGRLHLRLYWGAKGARAGRITSALGETSLEAHALGFGNLARYVETHRPGAGEALVEDYQVVIPSTVDPGVYPLVISVNGQRVETGQVTLGAE